MIAMRPLRNEDSDSVRAWFHDPETRRWLGGPDWPAQTFRLARAQEGFGHGRRALLALHAGEPIGLLDVEVYADRRASFALVVTPSARRKGFASAMIDKLQSLSGLEPIDEFFAGVESGNVASERLIRANGFIQVMGPDADGFVYFARSRETLRDPWALPIEPRDRQARDRAL